LADYYIATDGNDSDPGTLAEPWLTFDKANTTLTAGDTVYVRGGTYDDNITVINSVGYTFAPTNSGTSGNLITYQNYNGESVTVTVTGYSAGAIYLVNKSYIKIDGFNFGRYVWWGKMWAGNGETTSNNIIQNCYFDHSQVISTPYYGFMLGAEGGANVGTCESNQFIDNTFTAITSYPNGDVIYVLGGASTKYNLIQGNTFLDAPHVVIELQEGDGLVEYNIIKNNTIRNKWHTGINCYGSAGWNLIEGNTIYDCGTDHANNAYGSAEDRALDDKYHPCIIVEGTNNIIRKNTCYNNGDFGVENYGDDGDDNKIYNNTFYDNHMDWFTSCSDQVSGNRYKNNISSEAKYYAVYHDAQHATRLNYFQNNCFYSPDSEVYWYNDGAQTVSWMETNHSSLWGNNTTSDPSFVNAAGKDFTLQTGSPCINTGAWLTHTNGAGSASQTLIVDDASYFCDGWTVTTGDTIQIEDDATTAVITAINYGTNTITIDTPLTWVDGKGVALEYTGTAPDMGANNYESGAVIATNHMTIDSGMALTIDSGYVVTIE
jgi:parallel beta-helix repeat protein